MHYFEKLGSKSLGIDFKGRFLSMLIILLIFSIYIFVKAENPKQQPLTEAQKLNYGISLSRTLDIASDEIFTQEGVASWYGRRFHNRLTANGERYDMYKYTAAHRKLPFGTILRVTNKNNGEKSFVRVNDRGPYVGKRILDLSYQSAKNISGVGLPKIIIEGFTPKSLEYDSLDKIFYYSYSYDYPLVCLPENSLIIIDSAKTFEDAVNLYEKYNRLFKNEITYLSIPVHEMKRKENRNDYDYYISFLNIEYDLLAEN